MRFAPVNLSPEGFLEREAWYAQDDPALLVLPDELYLRELYRLDLDDEEAVLGFASDFGTLRVPLPGAIASEVARTLAESRGMVRLPGDQDFPAAEVVRQLGAYRVQARERANASRSLDPESTVHIGEFREAARLLRDLTRIYWTLQDEGTDSAFGMADVQAEWESAFAPAFADPPWPQREEAALFLAGSLTHLLEPFGVRVLHKALPEPHWNTLACLALQLANHIAEGAIYHACANEPCESLFVRQRSAGERDRPARLVKVRYCSRRCANAAAQREFRRSKPRESHQMRSGRPASEGLARDSDTGMYSLGRKGPKGQQTGPEEEHGRQRRGT